MKTVIVFHFKKNPQNPEQKKTTTKNTEHSTKGAPIERELLKSEIE